MTVFDDHRDDASPAVLSHFQPMTGRPILDELERYWRDLRGARRLPVRSEVDPARIDAALPHAFVIERVAPGIARLRVTGQKLNACLGMDARGMPLSTFFTPAARPMLATHLETVFDGPALVDLPLTSARGIGRPLLTGRLLLLPLLGSDGTVSRALGALMTDGMIGRAPRRFDIAPGDIRSEIIGELTRPRLALAGGQEMAGQEMAGQEMAGQGRVAGPKGPDAPRPALRLVVSNG